MMKQKRKKSIRKTWMIHIVIILVLFNLLVAGFQWYLIYHADQEITKSITQNIKFQVGQLEKQYEKIEEFLISETFSAVEYEGIVKPQDQIEYYLAQSSIKNHVVSVLAEYPFVDGFYFFYPVADLFISVFQSECDLEERMGISKQIINLGMGTAAKEGGEARRKWILLWNGDSYYLVKRMENFGTYIGSMVRVDHLLDNFQLDEIGQCIVCNERNIPLMQVSSDLWTKEAGWNDSRYMFVQEKSSLGPIVFTVVCEKKNLLYAKQKYFIIALFSVLIIVGITILVSYDFRKQFLRPVSHLVKKMDSFRNNEGVINQEGADCEEFQIVYDTLGKMVQRIISLNQQIYEEKLQKQQVSIQYLQLQIDPHFQINCMNLLRNLIYMGEMQKAEAVTVKMGTYMRYVMRPEHFVTLEQELSHISIYFDLQKYRYEGNIELRVDVDKRLYPNSIPIMLLQTFVENSVKHQADTERILHVAVEAELEAETQKILLTVQDDGDGFEENLLKKIQAGEIVIKQNGEHVGIYNVCRRLELLYGKESKIVFSNSEVGGAVIQIWVPRKVSEWEEK